jgi:hypothetical protein
MAAPSHLVAAAVPTSALDKIVINMFASQMKPIFAILAISAGFSAMLIPMLLVLFAFSTAQARRKPLFVLVVFDVLLGLGLGAWSMKRTVRPTLSSHQ